MQTKTYIQFRKKRTFSETMNAIIEFAKLEYKGMLKAQLFITGPIALIGSILFALMFDAFFNLGLTGDPSAFNLESVIYMIGAMLASIVAQCFVTAVSLDYVYIYVNEKPETITPAMVWKRSKNTVWGILIHTIILILLLVLLYVVMFGGFYALVAILSEWVFLLFWIPIGVLLYLVGVFSLYFPVYVYESRGLDFPTIIKRCFFLIKNNWWKTFGIFMITSIVVGVISSIFFIPPYLALIFTIVSEAESGGELSAQQSSLWMTVFYTLYMLARFILAFLILTGMAFQYYNLAEHKEAKGLMDTIASIDSEDRNSMLGADRAGDSEDDEDY